MDGVRAFVGHSFTQDDHALVSVFLKHFDVLQKSLPNFGWVNAEPAEPAELAAKVIRLMSDANVFIAICTKKQRSIAPPDLIATWLPTGFLKAPQERFLWKTSDWVMQEIGLAIGKGLSIIILLESGVERPGGLQGNIEHIEFERANPEAKFDKILEMITALSPKLSKDPAKTSDPRLSPSEQAAEVTVSPDEDYWTPKVGWTQFRYDTALWRVIFVGDENGLKGLNEAYAKTEHFTSVNEARWNALIEYHKLAMGKGSIGKLKTLADANATNSGVGEQLARGYSHLGEDREAARTFEEAAELAPTPKEKVRLLAKAVQSWTKANESEALSCTINKMRAEARVPNTEFEILGALLDVAKSNHDNEGDLTDILDQRDRDYCIVAL